MNDAEDKMKKSVEAVERELRAIRTGRANPAMLDKVTADYYGTQTPLNQMANISNMDARTLAIKPFDPSVLKVIEKSITDSNLGLTPGNMGDYITIVVPELTGERRKELVKHAKEEVEKGKVSIRNARRDALDQNKKDDEATEDDKRKFQDDIQKLTDKYTKLLDEIMVNKEKEILTV